MALALIDDVTLYRMDVRLFGPVASGRPGWLAELTVKHGELTAVTVHS